MSSWGEKASTSKATIREWAARWPRANLGIALGVVAESHVFVLDVDPRNGGDRTLADLLERHGDLPRGPEVATGRGGRHLYLRVPAIVPIRCGKLGPGLDDLDLNREEFAAKVNADLVGKVVNLASRTAKFVADRGLSPVYPDDGGLFAQAAAEGEAIAAAYESCDYNRAMRLVMALADRANQYVDAAAPWKPRPRGFWQDPRQEACTIALNLFRQIVIYLAPVLPSLREQAEKLLGQNVGRWEDAGIPLVGTPVGEFTHMIKRLEPAQVEAMIAERAASNTSSAAERACKRQWTSHFNPSPANKESLPLWSRRWSRSRSNR